MKKVAFAFVSLMTQVAAAQSEVVCVDSYAYGTGGYGTYQEAVSKINERVAKMSATAVSAPTIFVEPKKASQNEPKTIICVTVTK